MQCKLYILRVIERYSHSVFKDQRRKTSEPSLGGAARAPALAVALALFREEERRGEWMWLKNN